jgi:methylated-DNA-[protein]-cysteine S-methyltransferase
MPEREFALFDTLIGRCAIAWGPQGICLLQLPEAREAATRARVLERVPGAREAAPTALIQEAMLAIGGLLSGVPVELERLPLDMSAVPPFHRLVYAEARSIPPGQKLTYGELAQRLVSPGSARAVGQALGRNPFAIVVPCHRVFAAGGKVGGFSASGGTTTKLRLLALESPRLAAGEAGAAGFSFNPKLAEQHLRGCDARLRRLMDAVGPFRMQLQSTPSVFGALAEAIVYQQLHGKAAASIFARLCALFGAGAAALDPEQLLGTSDERLRSAGLSRAKLLSLQDLARRTQAGELPTLEQARSLDDETLVERLTQVRGIGRWTVEMLLMFRLGRPDVLPVDDFGIRKGFGVTFGDGELAERKQLASHAERWRPYRSVASWYLWRAAEAAAKARGKAAATAAAGERA